MFKSLILTAIAVTTVSAQYEFFTTVSDVANYGWSFATTRGRPFYRGIIRGLQANTENLNHQCVKSFGDFADAIDAMPGYLTALGQSGGGNGNTLVNALTTNPYYQPGTYLKLVKRSSEIAAVGYNMFDSCYLDDLLISFGRSINSLSGAANTLTVSVVYILNILDVNNGSTDLRLLLSAVDNNRDQNLNNYILDTGVEQFAVILGRMVTKIFNIKVPDFQYQDYK